MRVLIKRHHERRGPGLQVFLRNRLAAARLLGTLNFRSQCERVVEDCNEAEIPSHGLELGPRACRGPAGERAAHVAHTTLDARGWRTERAPGLLLHEERSELERNRIEPA